MKIKKSELIMFKIDERLNAGEKTDRSHDFRVEM